MPTKKRKDRRVRVCIEARFTNITIRYRVPVYSWQIQEYMEGWHAIIGDGANSLGQAQANAMRALSQITLEELSDEKASTD